MEAGLVDRPEGTGDVLLMLFHGSCSIDGSPSSAMSLRCWPHGAGHHYGSLRGPWHHSWIHCSGPLADACARALPQVAPVAQEEGVQRHFLQAVQSAALDRDDGLAVCHLRALQRCLERLDCEDLPAVWRDLRSWMECHLHEDWALEDLAARVGLAKSRFSECFRRLFGRSPMAYLQELRLRQARWLLQDRNRTVAAIARQVGYQDHAYFCRLIKRRYGCTPSALREPGSPHPEKTP